MNLDNVDTIEFEKNYYTNYYYYLTSRKYPSITISVNGFLSLGNSASWSLDGRFSLDHFFPIAIIAITL